MTATPDAAAYLRALIACPSVTPVEGGAQAYLEGILRQSGFTVERPVFTHAGTPDVDNLFATIGNDGPHLVFAGHTDVVPTGDEAAWRHPPFSGTLDEGEIYGRGAVDMKGGIACFMAAAAAFLDHHKGELPGRLSFLITGDEEGPAINGTVKLLDWALERGHRFDAALVGEPTSRGKVGDTIKIGRRGSLSGILTASGRQGHAAYPHLAHNPHPAMITALGALRDLKLDEGSDDFQPSNIEITSIDTGNPAFNIIPQSAQARFNIRFNDAWTVAGLQGRIIEALEASGAGAIHVEWVLPAAQAFITHNDDLVTRLAAAIMTATGLEADRTTGGGTSDARFFKDVCPVCECGLIGVTMHQIDERVRLTDLQTLTDIYRNFLDRFFARSQT
jgi:succinyl-diaminopimelate desuccinylase